MDQHGEHGLGSKSEKKGDGRGENELGERGEKYRCMTGSYDNISRMLDSRSAQEIVSEMFFPIRSPRQRMLWRRR